MSAQHYDVIIVGGGMVGACMAGALAQTPLRIALVEGRVFADNWSNEHYDPRVSAISRASQNILSALGAWETMVAERVSPYSAMHVWDACGRGEIHFDCADIGEPTLGHIIENRVILKGLLHALQEHNNVELLCPASPREMTQHPEHVSLYLDNGAVLQGKLLIGADGANSWVRIRAGISTRDYDYQQQAIVTTVKTERYHQDTAWQRFLPTGPLAFLPLPDGYSSIVWSTGTEHAQQLLAMDDAEFKHALQQGIDNRLGEIISVDERAAFPLKSRHANEYIKPRMVLIGDAAHTIHPLAGQGVNLGFADAASLAEVLLDALAANKDIGQTAVLRRYERWRKGSNLAMLSAMSGFKHLFGNELPVVTQMRNLGLSLTNRSTPMKNLFIRYAMGLKGDLPKLARAPLA